MRRPFAYPSALRPFFAALLALLLSLPSPVAFASPGAALLLCTPSGQPVSTEAESAAQELQAALRAAMGEPDPAVPPLDCEDCLPSFMALASAGVDPLAPSFRSEAVSPVSESHMRPFVRGPPLGPRAPPSSV
ncbi:MAG: hypothetical protein WBA35_05830 [Litorimonas sp.]